MLALVLCVMCLISPVTSLPSSYRWRWCGSAWIDSIVTLNVKDGDLVHNVLQRMLQKRELVQVQKQLAGVQRKLAEFRQGLAELQQGLTEDQLSEHSEAVGRSSARVGRISAGIGRTSAGIDRGSVVRAVGVGEEDEGDIVEERGVVTEPGTGRRVLLLQSRSPRRFDSDPSR